MRDPGTWKAYLATNGWVILDDDDQPLLHTHSDDMDTEVAAVVRERNRVVLDLVNRLADAEAILSDLLGTGWRTGPVVFEQTIAGRVARCRLCGEEGDPVVQRSWHSRHISERHPNYAASGTSDIAKLSMTEALQVCLDLADETLDLIDESKSRDEDGQQEAEPEK